MLIEQVNGLDPEPLKRALHRLFDMLRLAVHACRSGLVVAPTQVETKLGRDHYLAPKRSEAFAHKLFVQERAVNFGGVKECDPAFHSGTENRNHLLFVLWRAVGKAHSHAPQTKSRNFQIAFSKFAL